MKLCFFMGHRDAPEALFPALEAEVERHITGLGVTDFVVGHYGQFDRLAARAVRQAKKRHPQVSLTLLLPTLPGVQSVPIPRGFDGVFCPPGLEGGGSPILRANRCMAGRCQYLIAYVRCPSGNAARLVDYVRPRQRRGDLTITLLPAPGDTNRPPTGQKNCKLYNEK